MKSALVFCVLVLASCVHTPTPPPEQRVPAQTLIPVPAQQDITIWTLQDLARAKKFDVLNELFNNHGVTLERLPQGYAAGSATRVLDMGGPVGKNLEFLTGKSWRGKIFFPSTDPRKSHGKNRISAGLTGQQGILPMAFFTTELLNNDVLTPDAKSNLVNLNYAEPVTKGYWQEKVLKFNTQVYDLMVPVQGKYGVVYIGKTWLGKYDANGNFTAKYPDNLMAWFFLDFSAEALKVQQEEHWDGSKETILDPLPSGDKPTAR